MPFKSKAQQRFMFAAEERGDIPKGTSMEWAHKTPSIKKLPERKHKKTASELAEAALSTSKALRDFYEGGKWAPGGVEYQGVFKLAAELPTNVNDRAPMAIGSIIGMPKMKQPMLPTPSKAKKTAAEIAEMVMKKVAAYWR
jgi:hypothetical protein